jgi:transcriptional regulator with XRE-family HTH domain
MAKRKPKITQPEIVERFAARLREARTSRGMTQAELARQAHIAASYVWRLESGAAAPSIDLVDRIARCLGLSIHELLPTATTPEPLNVLREQASQLFAVLLETADQPTLMMVCPLLARLIESPTRRR